MNRIENAMEKHELKEIFNLEEHQKALKEIRTINSQSHADARSLLYEVKQKIEIELGKQIKSAWDTVTDDSEINGNRKGLLKAIEIINKYL